MGLPDISKSKLVAIALIGVLTVVGSLPVTSHFLQRLNYLVYDLILPLQSSSFSEDIVVVAIDDNSLQELGRWPWNRSRHAELISRLTEMQAKAIGLDIIFAEHQTDDPDADSNLASAIEKSARTVLAIAPSKQYGDQLITELLPIPELANAASGLGHVDVELDVDGLCRSTFLYAGLGMATWPGFPLAILQKSGQQPKGIKIDRSLATDTADGWIREHKILIPFIREQQPRQFSYSDVLAGRIPADNFRNKFILVGATAAGLGDAISTPGAFSHERMPGIVLNAQILNSLLQGNAIGEISSIPQTLLSAVIILLSLIGIVSIKTPKNSLLVAISCTMTPLLLSVVLLTQLQLWFAPVAAMLAIALCWPLWTLWRLHLAEHLQIKLQQQLERQAHFHSATELPNVKLLEKRLEQLAEQPNPQTTGLMVLHINWPGSASVVIDRPISDPILKGISKKLQSSCKDTDFIAHLSGDDFAVLSSGHKNSHSVQQAAVDLLHQLQKPLLHEKEQLLLAPQIGLSIWPIDTLDVHALLRNAYTAMFKSRIDETEHLCIYSSGIADELQSRSQLEQALVYALERNEFELYYQPQVDARNENIVGVETLVRWYNPTLGWVSPDSFIPVAEHIGLIDRIGEWIIETACLQLHLWNQLGMKDLRLAINVSPLQFMVPGLENRLLHFVEKYELNPACIELEITESSLMRDIETAIKVMKQVKQYGMELAIDDFGTGYSSLSNLRHFPLDRLKIDRSFTMELGDNNDSTEITLTILAMAKNLGLKIIAEGVETQEQAEFLRRNGCNEFQGYLYYRPVSADMVTEMLLAKSSISD